MAAHGARRLLGMAESAAAVVGIELITAAQGCDFHRPLASSPPLQAVHACIRATVPYLEDDQYIYPYLQSAADLARSGAVATAAGMDLLPAISAA